MLDLRRSALHAALLLVIAAVPARALCPNGILEPPEQCDDGNDIPGDGCSPLCLLEVPNLPPVCNGAFASPDSLWPPNHKFVPVAIGGVVDPDGDPLRITITGVAQDEPADAEGDGSTCADATGIGTDVVALRSERSGQGDGRVYHVAFRADDPHGATCLGEVEVCVRHDNGHGGGCGDQGPLFDSTVGVCTGPGTTTTAAISPCACRRRRSWADRATCRCRLSSSGGSAGPAGCSRWRASHPRGVATASRGSPSAVWPVSMRWPSTGSAASARSRCTT